MVSGVPNHVLLCRCSEPYMFPPTPYAPLKYHQVVTAMIDPANIAAKPYLTDPAYS